MIRLKIEMLKRKCKNDQIHEKCKYSSWLFQRAKFQEQKKSFCTLGQLFIEISMFS